MERIKVSILLFSIVVIAFFWGYRKDEIRNILFAENSELETVAAGAPAATMPENAPSTTVEAPTRSAVLPSGLLPSGLLPSGLQPTATPGVVSAPTSVNSMANAETRSRTPAPFPSPSFPNRRNVAAQAAATPTPYGFPSNNSNGNSPANPYQEFLKQRSGQQAQKKEGLSDTLNSINSGEIRDRQITRRNAYFEKLSQQLKELKGEQAANPDTQDQNQADEPDATSQGDTGIQNPDEIIDNELLDESEQFIDEELEPLGDEMDFEQLNEQP